MSEKFSPVRAVQCLRLTEFETDTGRFFFSHAKSTKAVILKLRAACETQRVKYYTRELDVKPDSRRRRAALVGTTTNTTTVKPTLKL